MKDANKAMPFFHPVLNELPIRQNVFRPMRWQMFKAKLFGKRVKYPDGKTAGYRLNGIYYVTNDPDTKKP